MVTGLVIFLGIWRDAAETCPFVLLSNVARLSYVISLHVMRYILKKTVMSCVGSVKSRHQQRARESKRDLRGRRFVPAQTEYFLERYIQGATGTHILDSI